MKSNNPIIFDNGRQKTNILMEAPFRHKELVYFSNYFKKSPSNLWLNGFRHAFNKKCIFKPTLKSATNPVEK